MYTFFLAVFGALCWGIAPVFGKLGLRGVNPIDALAARTLITVLLVAGWFWASGGAERISSITPRAWLFLALEAFFATFAGDLAYYAAIKWGELGLTALVLAMSPVVTVWIGWQFLGETLTPVKAVGTALVVIGIVLVGTEM